MAEKIIFKKILFILIVVLFFSCEKEKIEMNGNKNLKGYLITEKEAELSIFAMDSGKALNTEWPIFKKATEMTNIRLKNIASQNQTNQTEAYNLLVSSGQLPDIVSYMDTAVLERLGMEGGLIPLEDLIEKYAPNIKNSGNKIRDIKKMRLLQTVISMLFRIIMIILILCRQQGIL